MRRDNQQSPAQLATKRVIDVVAACMLIVFFGPLLLVVAAAVTATSPGPVVFRQERVGKGGRPFIMWKFRTMVVDQSSRLALSDIYDHGRALLLKRDGDPRVTRVGRVLRRTSIDELPQLFNVLVGDMSLVGPRPLMAYMLRPYRELSDERSTMRPGITGLWQVSDRSMCDSALAMAPADLGYIRRFSLLLDARILLATIPACLSGKGAF